MVPWQVSPADIIAILCSPSLWFTTQSRATTRISLAQFNEINFPYLYVSSALMTTLSTDDKYFVEQLPYTDEEIVEMSKMSFDDLAQKASELSIEDAAERAGGSTESVSSTSGEAVSSSSAS
jgi:hypothetical protein